MDKNIKFDDIISYYKKRQQEAKKRFVQAKENNQDASIARQEIDTLGNIINLFQNGKYKLSDIEKKYKELQEKLDVFRASLPEGLDFTNEEKVRNEVESIEKEIATAKDQFKIDHDNEKLMDTIQPLTEIKETLNQESRSHTMGNAVKEIAQLENERENIINELNENLPDEVELFKSSTEDELKRIEETQERAKEQFSKDHDVNKYMETVQPLTERKEILNQELRRINANNYTENSEVIEPTVGDEAPEEITQEVLAEGLDRLEHMTDEEFIRYSLKDQYTDEEINEMIGELKIVSDGAEDYEYDNPISKVNIVRETAKEETPEISPEEPTVGEETPEISPEEPTVEDETPEEDLSEEFRDVNKDMLDKYWGNKEKMELYKSAIYRIHNHIVDKDGYKTIEDYEELEQDLKFCKIEEFKERLERYSKGEEAYKELYDNAKLSGMLPKKSNGELLDFEEFFVLMQIEDEEYIKTNNQSYNRHQTTQESLKTLGKHGEKKPYYSLDRVEKNGKERYKLSMANLGKAMLNAYVFLLNNIKVPINKAVGTYVAAPIQKLLYESKNSSPYTNDRTHRYEARKAYAEEMFDEKYKDYLEGLAKENEERIAQGKKVKSPSFKYLFKKAFGPRFEAIFNVKELNIAVLAAQGHRNEENVRNRAAQLTKSKNEIDELQIKLEELLSQKEKLENELENPNLTDSEREIKENELKKIDSEIAEIQSKINVLSTSFGVGAGQKQNDAISMETHEKANRENVTKVVTGIKLATNAVAAKFLASKIYDEITISQTKEVKVDGGEIIINGTTPQELKDMTIGDMLKDTKGQVLEYDAAGQVGKTASRSGADYVRGLSFEWQGKQISLSDMYPVDSNGIALTTYGYEQIDENTKFLDAMAQAIQRNTGESMTAQKLAEMICKNGTPKETFAELFTDVDVALSPLKNGQMWRGWLDIDSTIKSAITDPSTIKEAVAESTIVEVDKIVEKVVRPEIVAHLTGLGVIEVGDIYDLLRRTESKREQKKRELEKEISKISKEYPEGIEREEAIKRATKKMELELDKIMVKEAAHAKSKKTYKDANIENKFGFTGTRTGDFNSPYYNEELEEDNNRSR